MSSSEDEGIDVKRKRLDQSSLDKDGQLLRDPLRIKRIVFDDSERLAVASFQSLGTPLPSKFAKAKTDMFGVKKGILTPAEERTMKNILAMEIPLGNGDSFRYEGSTPYTSEDTYDMWAAVVDEDTGEATLYPADVFHMMPCSNGFGDYPWRLRMDTPKNVEEPDSVPDSQDQEKKEPTKSRVQGLVLSDSFGTTAKQRRKKQTGQNRMTSTVSATGDVNQIITAAPVEQVKSQSDGRVPGDEFGILPPMNLNDPASPRDVVNGDDLVPPHVAELILSFPEVQKILENDQEQFDKWIEQIAFPSWFLNALKTLSYEEDRRKHQASFLFSAYILHRLVKAKYDDIRRVNGGLPLSWPNPLTEHFLKKYTQENVAPSKRKTRVMPAVLKDKAVLHAFFILLSAFDFSYPISEFVNELPGFNETRVQNLCNLGRFVRFARQGVVWIELQTPLPAFKELEKDAGASRKRKA